MLAPKVVYNIFVLEKQLCRINLRTARFRSALYRRPPAIGQLVREISLFLRRQPRPPWKSGMASELIVVAGGGGFIGAHLAKSLLAQGSAAREMTKKPLTDWWQRHAEPRIWSSICKTAPPANKHWRALRSCTTWPLTWAAWALSKQQSPLHVVGADQYAFAHGGQRTRHSAIFLRVERVCLCS